MIFNNNKKFYVLNRTIFYYYIIFRNIKKSIIQIIQLLY